MTSDRLVCLCNGFRSWRQICQRSATGVAVRSTLSSSGTAPAWMTIAMEMFDVFLEILILLSSSYLRSRPPSSPSDLIIIWPETQVLN